MSGGLFVSHLKGSAVKFTLSTSVPNGTVLLFGIRYANQNDQAAIGSGRPSMQTRPRRDFTYAMLKAGGLWYVTGSGKVPTAAGWGAIERWLERDGREVVWVKAVTETTDLWPAPGPVRATAVVGQALAAPTREVTSMVQEDTGGGW